MEKELRLQLKQDGKWEESESHDLGYSLENNATSIIVELPSQVHGFTHFLEFVKPSGDVISTLALTEDDSEEVHTVTFVVSSELIDEEGRYAMQYVGRNNNKVVKSEIIALDIDPSVNAVISIPDNSQDFVSWASEKIQYLLERIDGDEDTDFVTLADMSSALAGKVDKVEGKGLSDENYSSDEKSKLSGIASGAQVNVLEDVKVNGTSLTKEGKAVNIDLSGYETKAGAKAYAKSLEVSMNSSTYVLTFTLKDANGNTLSTQSVDLPSESAVVGGTYDNNNKRIVLLLQSGQTINVPVSDLISGLVSTSDLSSAISTALANHYTKSEMDTALGLKANSADVYGKSEVYTKQEVDTAMQNAGAGGKLIDNDADKEYKQYLEIEDDELYMTFEEITD